VLFNLKKMKKIYVLILMAAMFTSCLESKVKEDDHGHGHGGHDDHGHEDAQEVHLKKSQIKLMEIEVESPKEEYISTSIKANGTLELPPQNKASLSAIAEGRVKSILIIEGAAVKKGQTIAFIENLSFIEIQKKYLTLKRKNVLLQQDYERKSKLIKDSIVSEKDFQLVTESFENNQIELKATRAQLILLGINIVNLEKGTISTSIPIKSPISGYVRVININMNTYVHTGDVLFEVVDNEHIHIDLMVFEKDVPFIRKDQRVTFSMAGMPNKKYEASVFAVGKALEKNQRAMRVHAELKEEYSSLLPGMYVNATIYSNNFMKLALPEEAFIEEAGASYIFIKSKKSTQEESVFEKVSIEKGKLFEGVQTIELSKQLKKDSKVVVKGAYYLNAEMNKEQFEHSH